LHHALCYLSKSSAHLYDLPSFPTRRSSDLKTSSWYLILRVDHPQEIRFEVFLIYNQRRRRQASLHQLHSYLFRVVHSPSVVDLQDRKSTRLNSSHVKISYAVFCLKKKNQWI